MHARGRKISVQHDPRTSVRPDVRDKLVAANVTPLEQQAFYNSCKRAERKPADVLRAAIFAFQAEEACRKAILEYLDAGCLSVIGP